MSSYEVRTMHVPGASEVRDEVVRTHREVLGAIVHEDPERRGLMPNWVDLVETAARSCESDWLVILQDDAGLFDQTVDLLPQALRHAPAPTLGLTHFGAPFESTVERGIPYVVGPHLLWGGASAIHRTLLPGLAEFARRVYEEYGYPHDDRLLSAYTERAGYATAAVSRALFDQVAEDSLAGHSNAGNRPKYTVANGLPRFASKPAYTKRSNGGSPDQRTWLRDLWTPWAVKGVSYREVRKGAVTRVVER